MQAEDGENREGTRSGLRTRLMSLATLVAFVSGVVFVGREAHLAFTDSFIAPIILSPDNELVLQHKLKAGGLSIERVKAVADRGALAGEILAGEQAVERFSDLLRRAPYGVRKTLEEERRVLEKMARQQQRFVEEAAANLEARLITQPDFAKELQTLSQIQVAILENARVRAETELSREERRTRLELERSKLETELRSKRAEHELLGRKIALLDELESQLRGRPIFQAMSRSLEVAFIPYTQIEGVDRGDAVYDCVWGLLFCDPVGRVAELVPGEVVLTDPWGNPARGQYAVLALTDPEAARSKSLRVRPSDEWRPHPDVASK